MSGAGDREDGLNYLEFVTDAEISGFLGDVLREGVRSGEISAAGRIYSARASAIEGTDRSVVTFRDITEIMETERMKREFAANASHELRTPLTAIKGYGETLQEELTGDRRKHMETILRNTDRLIRIVEDMRILSELEHPMTSLDLSSVNMADLITDTVDIFRQKAQEKGLELVVRLEEDLPEVTADEFRIQQVLINLIENAIRYTSSGTVTVMAGKRGQFLTVIVSDTGPGIDEKHLPRLFERFYVVDKARSRDRGGTGLGLAIVKHIMTLHDGWIRVTSQAGSGSMFALGLPLDGNGRE
jgi:two-component system phosphate regulon sensor histidine kinase PhoR